VLRAARTRDDALRGVLGSYMAWFDTSSGTSVVLVLDGSGGLVGRTAPRPAQPVDEEARKRQLSDRILAGALSGESFDVQSGDQEEIIVLGDCGEIRASGGKVVVSDNEGARDVDLSRYPDGRTAVLDEMLQAIDGGPSRHDGAWGLENMLECEAIIHGVARSERPGE
jgi:hypothetical protein